MTPQVSLMVPVFNRADLVRECVESALSQTSPDLEVVLVDGASTDGTWDVCLEYATADQRVVAIRQEVNAGPVAGWRRCLEAASGEFATFLWSDDMLMPSFLERTTPFLADDEIAFVYTAAEIGASPGFGRVRYALPSTRIISSDAFVLGSLTTRGRFPVSPACAVFRLEDMRKAFVTELSMTPSIDLSATGAGVDLMFFLITASRRPRVAHVAAPLVFFRDHPGSISTGGRRDQVALQYALTRSWFAQEQGRSGLISTILAWHWLGRMRASRRLISPGTAARDYRGLTRPSDLPLAAIRLLVSRTIAHLPWVRDERAVPSAVPTGIRTAEPAPIDLGPEGHK